MRFIDPRTDFAFKKIFGSEESKPILISFLNALVYQGQPRIKDLEIIDPYQAAKVLGLKDTYLDVKALLDDDTKVIIEMQYAYLHGFEQRILYNASKGYANQLVRGQKYTELNPVIALTITNFNFLKNLSDVITYFDFKERTHLTDYPYSGITMIFVELSKFTKELAELSDITDKWIYFLIKARELETIPQTLGEITAIEQAFLIANEASFTIDELDQMQNQEFYRYDQQRLQDMAIKAQQQAEQARQQFEQARQQFEQAQQQAEQARQQTEQARQQFEQARQQTEQARQQTEQAQQQAEQARQQTEQAQQQAEQARQQTEQAQQELQQEKERKKTLLLRQLSKKFGEIDTKIQEKINLLSTTQLESLAETFLDFDNISDLISWLE